jgi:hypothetical protein
MTAVEPQHQSTRHLTNGELATEVMAQIRANITRWHQGSWRTMTVDLRTEDDVPSEESVFGNRYDALHSIELYREDPLNPHCQTAFCEAGWVAALDHVKWAHKSIDLEGSSRVADPDLCDCTTLSCTVVEHTLSVMQYAQKRLKITWAEADILFHSQRTLSDLEQLNAAIAEGVNLLDVHLYDEDEDNDYDDDDDDDDDRDYA